NLNHVVGVSEQNLHLIRAVHIIMSGTIMDGKLALSSEHDGYAWVYFENLKEYELADWLKDYVNNQYSITSCRNEIDEKNESENKLKPWIKTIKNSIDSVRKQE
ncbi:MAG: NUDIX hydrolase, partial [Methanobacteriaceae archaeon]|nr:NUDIX hydrolase [Methanobacteriaceae archaeon]